MSEFDPVVSDLTARLETQALAEDLDGLLGRCETFLCRYVVFANAHQSVAVTLHVAHAHAIEAADATAYLNPHSAEKRSGKTRLLETYELLVPRPVRGSSMSPSVLFRVLDAERRTLLLDEVDAIFSPKSDREELRGLLNAGYRRGSPAWRIAKVGKDFVPTPFDAFGAKVLAGIGRLPDTVADRCIGIELRRRRRGEHLERFRYREAKAVADTIRDALAAWASEETVQALSRARPELPDIDDDRALEGWEPLLAIADAAGGTWPLRARAACIGLHGESEDDSEGVVTLAAIREMFGEDDRMTSDDLINALASRDDGPWPYWFGDEVGRTDRDGFPIPLRKSGRKLARVLHPFGIGPGPIKLDDRTSHRGYMASWFSDAWDRYLPSVPVPEEAYPGVDDVDPQASATSTSTSSTGVYAIPGTESTGCVRCDRYGNDHVGKHIRRWTDVAR